MLRSGAVPGGLTTSNTPRTILALRVSLKGKLWGVDLKFYFVSCNAEYRLDSKGVFNAEGVPLSLALRSDPFWGTSLGTATRALNKYSFHPTLPIL
jgi:hypothetical protein